MLTGNLAPSSAADWLSGIATSLAVAVTSIVALLGYLADKRLRSDAARTSVLLAKGIADRAIHQLGRSASFQMPDAGSASVRYGAKSFLSSAAWLEINESIMELRPKDLPTVDTAESFVHIRSIIRVVARTMNDIAALPTTADGGIPWPDFSLQVPILQRESDLLGASAARLKQPYLPRFVRVFMPKRRLRKLARQEQHSN